MSIGLILSSLPQDRLFGIDIITITSAGANLLNVAILAVVLAFLLYRPVRTVLQKRTDRIKGQLTQAEEDMSKAMDLKQQYEDKIKEIGRERDEILSDAHSLATETSKKIISEAKA